MEPPPPESVDFVPIPEIFHSEETGRMFEKCSVCGGPLLEDGTGYLIEKGRSKGEAIFEYAMCFRCHGSVRGELSAASLRRIDHYMGERVDLVAWQKRMAEEHPGQWEPRIERCLLSGKPLGDEFQIFAQCDGSDLVLAYLPYAISGAELENLIQVLSKETRERLDDFVDDVLGLPGDRLRLPVMV